MINKNSKSESMFTRVLYVLFPFVRWFKNYNFELFKADLIAGVTVALVLIPQSMAYAQLANLPAYYGLYASFLPPIVASLFGSSRQLATGPVAIVSLMTATALEPLATAGSESFIAYAILLALIVGLFQFLLGIFRLGLIINFLSHPVVNGFTNAAALIIASSQFAKLFGVSVVKAEHTYMTVYRIAVAAFSETHLPTLGLAVLSFAIMYGMKRINPRLPYVLIAVVITTVISWGTGFEKKVTVSVDEIDCPPAKEIIAEYNRGFRKLDSLSEARVAINKKIEDISNSHDESAEEAELEIQSSLAVLNFKIKVLKEKLAETKNEIAHMQFKLYSKSEDEKTFCPLGARREDATPEKGNWKILPKYAAMDLSKITFTGGGAVVGHIPKGLPEFAIPILDFRAVLKLLPMALIITLLGFMEAISIAKAMAAKTKQQLDPNRELIGQGLANIAGSFSGSYPVSGSFSRSAVNIQSGAVTGFSSAFTSIVVVITLLFLTPLLYHLPQSVLASIIILAVIGLVNVKGFVHAWKAQKYDGIISVVTFALTLYFVPVLDVGIMIGVGLTLVWFLFRNTKPQISMLSLHPDGAFRNRERFGLAQCEYIAAVRYNGSLFFANESYLDKVVVNLVEEMDKLKHIIIVGNGINELDASGENLLSDLVDRVRNMGVGMSFSGLNDHVIDTMKRTFLFEKIGGEHFYRNLASAVESIHNEIHVDSEEGDCPLRKVVYLAELDKGKNKSK